MTNKSEGRNANKECPTYSLYNYGPFGEHDRDELPLERGVYFAFEFDKERANKGMIIFKRLIYVGKATGENTLRKRIGEHYTQHDLSYRGTDEPVDMENIAFYVCVLKDDDDVISDIEAAQIYKQQPPANTKGIDHYIGNKAPIMISLVNDFKLVGKNLYKSIIVIRPEDKE